ncbi:erythroid membrane-associated protein-like [Latimeria chalumnae]|uniref:erythroid membrane-associated protein-like n=1 Tax=Latimeria chalumnae TaxID=7897 RepID=UPI0006D8E2BB|nr:PREDICTED: erythroid membrane-associated protein-like [Latimeria chalumnae]|eukprot:XP_014353320.1 PREDICTED: erythroid membrane-associated protein-like [Latimeria chalumnae]
MVNVTNYYDGKEQSEHQDAQFAGRVQLFPEEVQHGNASLRFFNLRLEDAGMYRCLVVDAHGMHADTAKMQIDARQHSSWAVLCLAVVVLLSITVAMAYVKREECRQCWRSFSLNVTRWRCGGELL